MTYETFTSEQLQAVKALQLARHENTPHEIFLKDLGEIVVEQERREG